MNTTNIEKNCMFIIWTYLITERIFKNLYKWNSTLKYGIVVQIIQMEFDIV